MKDNITFNQINTLFWLEEQLKIQRYCVNDIDKSINIDNIKKLLLDNIDKIIIFYVYNQSKNKTIKRITNIINKIYNHNKLQKFYADLINTICNDVIKIKFIRKEFNMIYLFCI